MYQTREAHELVKDREDEIIARAKAQSIARHGDESGWKLHMLAEVADLVLGGAPASPPAQPSTAGPAPVPEMRSTSPVARVHAGRFRPHHLEVLKVERTIRERIDPLVLPPLRPARAPAVAPAPAATPGPGPVPPSSPGPAATPGSATDSESAAAPAASQAPTPGPMSARASPATPDATQAPAPVPGSALPARTQQAHKKSLLILGEGATTHPDKKCIKCRPGNHECIVNPAVSNGNTCARCAKNKEKCSHQQVAEGRFIREHGRPARDGPCQHCKDRANLGMPAECYQADPTDKTQVKYGTACSQCCIDGTKDTCSANESQGKRKEKARKS
ncbi:hypothetical protein QBC37DRAFT_406375 [Rhypophila decipiens]|uniref:Uncharacterized protein n=1 Tax=Rhypophila decipiens TaxID=261697 RepID=A0AAN6XXA3_9PEZI|nr:hypothetical protein QBC37DRAFT_406375 [Rhypophila decipiens]